jgi:hypothetical protein
VKEVLDELKKTDAQDPKGLGAELMSATDRYARAVREFNPR